MNTCLQYGGANFSLRPPQRLQPAARQTLFYNDVKNHEDISNRYVPIHYYHLC